MAWSPRQEGLDQILQLLRESQSPDTQTQRAVQQVSHPFFQFIYCLLIFLMFIQF
jgi:cation transport ATPase